MHDTQHYRECAASCEELSEEASLPISIRELYRDVAARWLRLADDVVRDAQRDTDPGFTIELLLLAQELDNLATQIDGKLTNGMREASTPFRRLARGLGPV